jgi:formylglycine-generating enzyme required for sulfatase activity
MLTKRTLVGMIGLCVLLLCLWVPSWAQKALDQPGTKVGDTATGPDGGTYVWVPAGEFDMGAEDLGDWAKPVHHVRITKGFWLGKCTVTLGQWKAYCEKVGIKMEASAPGDNHPVVNVNWDDAVAYCKHYGLSLPTEAQWEYAARGPEGREYPWGNEWEPKKCCSGENTGPKWTTFPVGSFPEGASWCGALDMAGNVWQWCKDWFDSKYYANSPDTDPPGPSAGEDFWGRQYRALRGGSWIHGATVCRGSCRIYVDPSARVPDNGLRASRTP